MRVNNPVAGRVFIPFQHGLNIQRHSGLLFSALHIGFRRAGLIVSKIFFINDSVFIPGCTDGEICNVISQVADDIITSRQLCEMIHLSAASVIHQQMESIREGETCFLQEVFGYPSVLGATARYIKHLNTFTVSVFQKIRGAGQQQFMIGNPLLPGVVVCFCFRVFCIIGFKGRVTCNCIVNVQDDSKGKKMILLLCAVFFGFTRGFFVLPALCDSFVYCHSCQIVCLVTQAAEFGRALYP